jgi:glutathione synthase/RimK-type ligase-like ATP-grasp enzyme
MVLMSKVSSPCIVIISHAEDEHLPFVTKHLTLPSIIIDHTQLLSGKSISHCWNGTAFDLVLHKPLPGPVIGVWYRRSPRLKKRDIPVPAYLREYSIDAVHDMQLVILSRFRDALWVSKAEAIFRANDKLLQLETAARLGFNVPDTLLTSSPQEAKLFIAKHPSVVTKFVQKSGVFTKEDRGYAMYTSFVDNKTDLSGLHLAPAFFQQAIEGIDIRATVVGKKVFAATVRVGEAIKEPPSHVRDWRTNYYQNNVIEAFDLPKKIAELCVEHVRELGLKFGALDLMMDKKGKFWFLENNPNGQWGFVELATGQPIGKAIADLLQSAEIARS